MTPERPRTEEELVELTRSIDIEAPPALRARVEEMIAGAPERGRLRRWSRTGGAGGGASPLWRARPLAGALAGALVIAAVLVAITSGGGGSQHTLSLRSAAAPTLLASTTPAPTRIGHSDYLATAVGDIRFPYLEDALGWRAIGARTDRIDGRTVTTVFYSRGRARIGYAIYASLPSSWRGGSVRTNGRTEFHVLAGNGATIIGWTRSGHLCVMSSHGASADELIRLARWGGARTLAA